jgi:hypothetical protein
MNADVVITIIFSGEVVLVGVAGGMVARHSARASKNLGGLEGS